MFVTLSKEEFEKALPEGYQEVPSTMSWEYIYDIPTPKDGLMVRIYSTVDKRTGTTRDLGKDAIRCVYWDAKNGRPIGKGKKILRVEGATTIEQRIKLRVQELLSKSHEISIIDPDYVRAVLNQFPRNNFAMSLLESLNKYKKLTDNQLAYVLGGFNPKGKDTFEQQAKRQNPNFFEEFMNSQLEEEEENGSEWHETQAEEIHSGTEDGESRRPSESENVGSSEVELVPTEGYPYFRYPFEHFNPPQSMAINYREVDRNLVVGAKTSSGKTIIGEFVMDHAIYGLGKKVVYTAPMKSLAAERQEDWEKRYADKKVVMLTGDTLFDEKERAKQMAIAAESDIIITTFELLDSITRKYHSEKYVFLQQVGALVMDEGHCLTMDNRGDIAESALIRFLSLNPKARAVLLSATMPNLRELSEWLTSLNGKQTDIVNCTWRPVPLQMNYVEYFPAYNAWGRQDYGGTEQVKENLCVEIAMSKPDEKFMIFVHAKGTGRNILSKLERNGVQAKFYNADLEREERADLEKSFKDRTNGIRVLVTTSATAIGVNLPARNVIVCGVNRGLSEVDPLEIIQELGRSGRPQYDDEAHGYLLVPHGAVDEWQRRIEFPRPVTSVMQKKETLAFHILAEIHSKQIGSVRDIEKWYTKTLAHKQEQEFTYDEVTELAEDLEKMHMIKTDGGIIKNTSLGNISAVLYYSPYDIFSWFCNFNRLQEVGTNDITLAWAIGNVHSNYLPYIPKEVRFECEEMLDDLKRYTLRAEGTIHSVVAAHCCLTGQAPNGALGAMMRALRYDIRRTSQTLYMIDTWYARWGNSDLWKTLSTRVIYGIPEQLVELVKIPGVGGKRAKMLWEIGIKSIADIANEENRKKILKIFAPKLAKSIIDYAKKC